MNTVNREVRVIEIGRLTVPTIKTKKLTVDLTQFLPRYKNPFLRLIRHRIYDKKGNLAKLGYRLKLGHNFLNSPKAVLANEDSLLVGNKKIKICNNKFIYKNSSSHVIHFVNGFIRLIKIPYLDTKIEKLVDNRNISYILGCITAEGDQHVELKFKRYRYEIVYVTEFYNNNKKILNKFKDVFNKVYSKRLNEYKYGNNTCLKCFSKHVFVNVRKYIGNKNSHFWFLPKFIDYNVAACFLRGFVDGEGSSLYNESTRGYYLRFHSVNKEGLLQIQRLLNKLHIYSRLYSDKNNTLFYINITGYENLKLFLKIIDTERIDIRTKICKYIKLMEKRYPIIKDKEFENQEEQEKWLREVVRRHGYFESTASRYRLECKNIRNLLKTMRIFNKIGKENGFSCYALTKSKRPRLIISKVDFTNFVNFLNQHK